LMFDLLRRRLEDRGYSVQLVRNVTDVDDVLLNRAAELGEDYRQLAKRETKHLQAMLKQLNFRPAEAEPRASEYVPAIADAVGQLLKSGHAYRLDNDIYFDTAKYADFAANTLPERLRTAFMANRGGDPQRADKRQPLDFLLWRGSDSHTGPAVWPSAIGPGRPGWHIECSVMAEQLLGVPFDLHGGGNDLAFPHHACERAQTAGLHNGDESSLARRWLHIAPLSMYGEKMSKSLGNLVFAHQLLANWSPNAIRLALMRYDHRLGGEWRPEFLPESTQLAEQLHTLGSSKHVPDVAIYLANIRELLDNNLCMPEVIRQLELVTADHKRHPVTNADRQAFRTIKRLLGLV
jgi:L-cysteine:1D-myo-inositol 2-amino-2-deoxy-alpha-D-glucopyranoside ligase